MKNPILPRAFAHAGNSRMEFLSLSASRQSDSLLLLSFLRLSVLPSKSVKLNTYITEMALETALHVLFWMSNQDSYSAEDPIIVTLFCSDIKRNGLCFHHVPVSIGPHLALCVSVILTDRQSVSEWVLMPESPAVFRVSVHVQNCF